ncbi:dihydrolipoyl dehydrogenase [Cupriavidus sp. 2KB_3]|uniref:dihydrolipoyl dehydrogenase n=1 Tax=Cupriavidus sp. 2KB_3 TaxID=3232980 RepID=UPI003F9088C0
MRTIHTDVAIIGAGSAGLSAYRAAVAHGKRALLIEGGPYGTTCARVGCMPSKLLIAASEAAHSAKMAADLGVDIDGTLRINGHAVMDRVRRERDRFVGFVVSGVENIPTTDRLVGKAHFIDNTVLQVGGDIVVRAGRVVIATGSVPDVPETLRVFGDRLIINDDVFSWNQLPRSVAIFGPGVIGLELGQALSRLGVRVRMFGRTGSLGGITDPVIRAHATQIFTTELQLDTNAKIIALRREGDEAEITFADGLNREITERFEYVLAATGRQPNIQSLELHNTSLILDASGVPRFDPLTLECAGAPVFIAGDANNVLPILHEAIDEGRTAGENAATWPEVKPLLRRAPLSIVFSDPQIAMVGKHFTELQPGKFVTGEVNFEDQGRSRIMLSNRGLMRLYVDRSTGRFLGAEWLGPRAEHLAHTLAWAYQQHLTVDQMLAMPFYHPVVEEGLRTALRNAAANLAHAS